MQEIYHGDTEGTELHGEKVSRKGAKEERKDRKEK
jgi:hypothetical protein